MRNPRSIIDIVQQQPVLDCPQTIHNLSKMYNGLEVTTEQLSNSQQPHWSFQMLSDAPRKGKGKVMCSQQLRDYFPGASQCFGSCGPEYMNILKSV